MGQKINRLFLPAVHTFVCLFGMASWLDINGLWIQLPILVNYLPEGWALASYLILIIQIANIGPIVFSVANKFTTRKIEIPTNYIIIVVGVIACLLLVPFWDRTSYVNGREHSTAFLILSGLLALVDCTSSLSFLAFMSSFPREFMSSYFVGEGFSALVPSVLGLIQGVGGNPECLDHTYINTTIIGNRTVNTTSYVTEYYYPPPRYSVELYFTLLAILLCLSLASFALLVHVPKISGIQENEKRGRNASDEKSVDNSFELYDVDKLTATELYDKGHGKSNPSDGKHAHMQDEFARKESNVSIYLGKETSHDSEKILTGTNTAFLSRGDWIYLLALQAWSCCLTNGVMPSIQSYSTLPYGNQAYHLAVTLGLTMIPTASLCVHWLPAKSNLSVGVLSGLATLVSAYILYLSLMSPYPPLCGNVWGPTLSVISWLMFYFIFTYVKVSIGGRFRELGRSALIWYGGVTQIGSFLGAIVIFPLVNVLYLFESNDPCQFTCY
ncbi:solute carrier family 52, riboflavin transporter, member 3-A-like [Ptychodera flava]|uniref:solute carrier family 52, riboflavin transporter, member 3-A-like n=1 Tax=Ptychodera flava TaxID=63121 RepID=UPI00396A147A